MRHGRHLLIDLLLPADALGRRKVRLTLGEEALGEFDYVRPPGRSYLASWEGTDPDRYIAVELPDGRTFQCCAIQLIIQPRAPGEGPPPPQPVKAKRARRQRGEALGPQSGRPTQPPQAMLPF